MNNGDMSAMPTTAQCERCNSTHYKDEQTAGLTKREHFAGLAMQGLLSNPILSQILRAGGAEDDDNIHTSASKTAIHIANALLAELDKVKA